MQAEARYHPPRIGSPHGADAYLHVQFHLSQSFPPIPIHPFGIQFSKRIPFSLTPRFSEVPERNKVQSTVLTVSPGSRIIRRAPSLTNDSLPTFSFLVHPF
jgi:hypothetical protein